MLSQKEGLEFRMLSLEHLGTCRFLCPVGEADFLIVLKLRFRSHGIETAVRNCTFKDLRLEIVFCMALTAGNIRCMDGANIITKRVCHILMGHCKLSHGFVIAMTVIAADAFIQGGKNLFEILGISINTYIIDQLGEVNSLTGKTVGLCMRSCRFMNVIKIIVVASGTLIVFCKTITFIKFNQIRILYEIISLIIMLAVQLY